MAHAQPFCHTTPCCISTFCSVACMYSQQEMSRFACMGTISGSHLSSADTAAFCSSASSSSYPYGLPTTCSQTSTDKFVHCARQLQGFERVITRFGCAQMVRRQHKHAPAVHHVVNCSACSRSTLVCRVYLDPLLHNTEPFNYQNCARHGLPFRFKSYRQVACCQSCAYSQYVAFQHHTNADKPLIDTVRLKHILSAVSMGRESRCMMPP